MNSEKSSFVVSLIGRPNVGKSSLFNRLMGRATELITHNTPGVTRDRLYGLLPLAKADQQAEAVLIDTGGLYPQEIPEKSVQDYFFNTMREQADLAISESDLVLMVVDGRAGVLPFDWEVARYLRSLQKEFWLLVNKCDTDQQEGQEIDFYPMAARNVRVFSVSAAHGRGIELLRESLCEKVLEVLEVLKERGQHPHPPSENSKAVLARLAIIGSPNVGKSTLLNALVGHPRALVAPIPGTTVDPIESSIELEMGPDLHGEIQLVDTAGIRRQKSVSGFIETQSVYRSLRAISRADVILYIVDATCGLTHQDRRLIDISLEKGCSVIICLNKKDLLPNSLQKAKGRKIWQEELTQGKNGPKGFSYCTMLPISAKKGQALGFLKEEIKKTIMVRRKKIPTGQLNRFLSELISKKTVSPARARGTPLKLKYASMVKSTPPTFLLCTNRSKGIPAPYQRYLKKNLRQHFELFNVPIHLIFRTSSEI